MTQQKQIVEKSYDPGRTFAVGEHTLVTVRSARLTKTALVGHLEVSARGRPLEVGRCNLLSLPSRRNFGAVVGRRLREIDPDLGGDAGLLGGALFQMTTTLYNELSER